MIEIPNFTIKKELGRGGMATVYLAVQDMLNRDVALKVLLPDMMKNENLRKNFLSEGNIIARLEHPNIIRIYDIGISDDTTFFMTMEYLSGGSLKDKLAKGSLPYSQSLKILSEISEGLTYAHSEGYIHRDIKPGNILFRANDDAVVTDFGIAKLQNTSGELTQMGFTMGTVQYMSPEQATTSDLDYRSDIYSLGLVFYEMLTGEKAFKADTNIQAIHQHTSVPPPKLPEEYAHLQSVIDKVLAKSPDTRYQSAKEFVEAINNPPPLATVSKGSDTTTGSDETIIFNHNDINDKTQVYQTPVAQKKSKNKIITLGVTVFILLSAVGFSVKKFISPPALQQQEQTAEPTDKKPQLTSLNKPVIDSQKKDANILSDQKKQRLATEQAETKRKEAENKKKRLLAEAELKKLEEEKIEKDRLLAIKIANAKKQAEEDREKAEAQLQQIEAEKRERERILAEQIAKAEKEAEEEQASALAEKERIAEEILKETKLKQAQLEEKRKREEQEELAKKQEQEELAKKQEQENIELALAEKIRLETEQQKQKAKRIAEQERLDAEVAVLRKQKEELASKVETNKKVIEEAPEPVELEQEQQFTKEALKKEEEEQAKAEATRELKKQRTQKLDKLRKRINTQISTNKLSSPAGNNAIETLAVLRQLDIPDKENNIYLSRIVEKYLALSRNSLRKGDINKANNFLNKARQINPKDKRIAFQAKQIITQQKAQQRKTAQQQNIENQAQKNRTQPRQTVKSSGHFLDHGNGTVTDTRSRLMWKKCSEGQTGGNCSKGAAKRFSWNNAVQFRNISFAGHKNWRLPNKNELRNLIHCSNGVTTLEARTHTCAGRKKDFSFSRPTINQTVFPRTAKFEYWTSTATNNTAWFVYFVNGVDNTGGKNSNFFVRLVRNSN